MSRILSLDCVVQNLISVYLIDCFLRLLIFFCHWTDDQSDNDKNQSGIMIQIDCQDECNPMTAQTKIHTQGLSVPSYFLIGYTWYILGINLVYTSISYVYSVCICSIYTQYILSIYSVYTLYMHCTS